MTEQTPNEPRDLDELESDLRHYESLFAAGRAVGWDRMREVVRDAADALEALRARPTLDRETLILALEEDKNWPGGEAEPKFQADSVLALLAAVGQDTPEPTPAFTVDTLLRGFGDHVRDGIGGCSCGWNQLGRSFSHHLTDSILAQ